MVAVSTACLTIYDMLKGIDRDMVISDVKLMEKSGGRSGHYRRAESGRDPPGAPHPHGRALGLDELVAEVSHPGAGGVATFLGVVRDENEGRARDAPRVRGLRHDGRGGARRGSSPRSPREIPGVRVAATHRIGALRVGDAAVACAASAPHRGEAFRACRELIDRIKARLPIWKREHGPDGPYWVGWEDARCGAEERRARRSRAPPARVTRGRGRMPPWREATAFLPAGRRSIMGP